MTEKEFYAFLGYTEAALASDARASDFMEAIQTIIDMLDSADEDDYFGTEGWKHHLGWDE